MMSESYDQWFNFIFHVQTIKIMRGHFPNALSVNTQPIVVKIDLVIAYNKNKMSHAKTRFNFENDRVTLLGIKVPMRCTLYSHYQVTITRLQPHSLIKSFSQKILLLKANQKT